MVFAVLLSMVSQLQYSDERKFCGVVPKVACRLAIRTLAQLLWELMAALLYKGWVFSFIPRIVYLSPFKKYSLSMTPYGVE